MSDDEFKFVTAEMLSEIVAAVLIAIKENETVVLEDWAHPLLQISESADEVDQSPQ